MSNEKNESTQASDEAIHKHYEGDELPGLDEKPLVGNFEDVKVIIHPEKLMFHRPDGVGVQGEANVEGFASYTEGLEESLGFELIAFSEKRPTEEDEFSLRQTAAMISLEIPHLIPIGLHERLLPYMVEAGIPKAVRVQTLIDHHALENDGPTRPETAQWVADGGVALFSTDTMVQAVEQFFARMDAEQQKRVEALRTVQRDHLKNFGFTQVGVFDPEDNHPPYVYTVGLSNKDLPELFISGRFDPQELSQINGQMHDHLVKAGKFEAVHFEDALKVDVYGRETTIQLRLIKAANPGALIDGYMQQAESILGRCPTQVALVQFSDGEGRFPGDENFDNLFSQIVL